MDSEIFQASPTHLDSTPGLQLSKELQSLRVQVKKLRAEANRRACLDLEYARLEKTEDLLKEQRRQLYKNAEFVPLSTDLEGNESLFTLTCELKSLTERVRDVEHLEEEVQRLTLSNKYQEHLLRKRYGIAAEESPEANIPFKSVSAASPFVTATKTTPSLPPEWPCTSAYKPSPYVGFPPVSSGSSDPTYTVSDVPDPNVPKSMLQFHSISAMQAYCQMSFEELRVQDYQQGRKNFSLGFNKFAFVRVDPALANLFKKTNTPASSTQEAEEVKSTKTFTFSTSSVVSELSQSLSNMGFTTPKKDKTTDTKQTDADIRMNTPSVDTSQPKSQGEKAAPSNAKSTPSANPAESQLPSQGSKQTPTASANTVTPQNSSSNAEKTIPAPSTEGKPPIDDSPFKLPKSLPDPGIPIPGSFKFSLGAPPATQTPCKARPQKGEKI